MRVSEFTSGNVARGRRLCAVGDAVLGIPCKCAVSDVLLSVLMKVSEFTSGNVDGGAGSAPSDSEIKKKGIHSVWNISLLLCVLCYILLNDELVDLFKELISIICVCIKLDRL